MPKRLVMVMFLIPGPLWAKEPCRAGDIARPAAPALIEVDLSLVHGESDQAALPEWSKVEKLRDFYKRHTVEQADCLIVEGGDLELQLFITREALEGTQADPTEGRFTQDKNLQFYGASRVKVERADQRVTREFAYPLKGPAKISDVAEGEILPTLIEDLQQLKLVAVPRFTRQPSAGASGEDCFLLSNATLVPSRVFDEPAPADDPGDANVSLTLDARRRVLEHLTREVKWLERVDNEATACRTSETDGFLGRQITSLNLTVGELVPEIDFVSDSIRFWRRVEQRIEELEADEEPWKKELRPPSEPRP